MLGLLNLRKGAVSIQSQNVRVLEEEEEKQQIAEEESFFLTQGEKGSHSQSKDAQNKIVQGINQQDSVHTRLDKKILQWKREDATKKVGFVKEILRQKNFMKEVGPGSYNLNVNNEVSLEYKNIPTSSFISNTQRLQEMN